MSADPVKRPREAFAGPDADEVARQRHMELLEAINRQTRSVTAALEQVRDAILRSR